MTQQYRNFTLRFAAFLFIKLPESEKACKQNVRSSLEQNSNPVFSKSSEREIEQDNRRATTCTWFYVVTQMMHRVDGFFVALLDEIISV